MSEGRTMWMLDPIFLDTNILEEEAVRLFGVANMSALKLGTMLEHDMLTWRKACYERVGVEDPDSYESQRLRKLKAYRQWKEQRRALQKNLTWQRD